MVDSEELSPKSLGPTNEQHCLPDYIPLDNIIQVLGEATAPASGAGVSTRTLVTMYPGASVPGNNNNNNNARRPTGTFQIFDEDNAGRPRLASGASFPRKQSVVAFSHHQSSMSSGHSLYEDAASPLERFSPAGASSGGAAAARRQSSSGRVPAYQAISAMRKPSYAAGGYGGTTAPPVPRLPSGGPASVSPGSQYPSSSGPLASPFDRQAGRPAAPAESYFPEVPKSPSGTRNLTRPQVSGSPQRPGAYRQPTAGSIDFSAPPPPLSPGGASAGDMGFISPFGGPPPPPEMWGSAAGGNLPLPSPISPLAITKPERGKLPRFAVTAARTN